MLRGKLCLAVIFTITSVSATIAQTGQFKLPTIIQPSPTASALGRYGEIPVSLSTGVPDISVPLYEINSLQINVPLGLSYHASGIKVRDRATPAGLGWALNAGGAVTRAKQGEWDEEINGFYNIIFPEASDPNLADKEKCLAAGMTLPPFVNTYKWDGQPDIFYYNVNGLSGKFMFRNKRVKGLAPEIVTIPYSNTKIEFISAGGSWGRIQITDENGTVYIFGTSLTNQTAHEKTHSDSGDGSSDNFDHITGWFLTNIISTDKSDTVSFNYASSSVSNFQTSSRSISAVYDDALDWTRVTSYQYSTVSNQNEFTNTLRVTDIQFKNGKATFDYIDLGSPAGVNRLSAIHIFQKKPDKTFNEIRKFDLFHSAFSSPSPENCLRLDSLIESGTKNSVTESKPAFKFDYFTNPFGAKIAPPYNSKSQDLWGYYNGKFNEDLLLIKIIDQSHIASKAADRLPDESYLKTATLRRIQYPTGGDDVFEFEANQINRTYTDYDTAYNYQGGHVNNLTQIYSETFVVSGTLENHYNPSPGIGTYNARFVFTADVNSPCTGCTPMDARIIVEDLTASSVLVDKTISDPAQQYLDPVTNVSTLRFYFNLISGHTYKISLPSPGTVGNMKYILNGYLDGARYIDPIITSNQITEPVLAGGLRIKKIIASDGFGKTIIKEYKYNKPYFNSTLFKGDYEMLAFNSYQFESKRQIPYGDTCGVFMARLQSRTYTGAASVPLGSSGNCAVSYEEVEEYQLNGSGDNLGKKVYTFQKALDDIPMFMPFFRADNSYLRSQLLKTQIYKYVNSAYSLIQEEITTYQDFSDNPTIWYPGSDKIKFYLATPILSAYSGDGAGYYYAPHEKCPACELPIMFWSSYRIEPFYISVPKVVKVETVSRTFSDVAPLSSVTSLTSYQYNNLRHLQPSSVSVIDSDQKVTRNEIRYPLDIALTGCDATYACEQSFLSQLTALKSTLYSKQSVALAKEKSFQVRVIKISQQTGQCFVDYDYPDSVLKYHARFNQDQAEYESSVTSLLSTRSNCFSSLVNCEQTFINAQTPETRAIFDLKSRNILAPALQQTQYVDAKLLTTTVNQFKIFPSNFPMPSKVQFSTLTNPLEDRLNYLSYNTSGRTLEQQMSNNIIASYIWDYRSQYPTAEVANASQADIAYCGFEADGAGNWNISSPLRDQSVSFIGARSYSLIDGSISKSGLNTSKTYNVSFWAKSTASVLATVNGVQPIQSTYKNGWYYCEAEVSGVSTVTIAGSDKIDELRLLPKGATMKTYTYDVLLGITTSVDENNTATFFEYDALGRLTTVRNNDKSIVKSFTYHFKK